MKRSIPSVLALALALGLAAPAVAIDKEQRQLMADVRMLQEQSQQLQNLINALNAALSEALKDVNKRLDDQANADRKAFADQKLIIDTLSSDLRVVREKVDDTNVRLGSVSQEVDALRQAMQTQALPRSTAVESPDAQPGAAPADPANPGAVAPGPAPVAIGTSPTKLYDQAFSNFGVGLYDLAIDGFEAYVRSFPRSDLADDAQVFIGNSYLQDGKNEKAIDAYDRAIRTYPGGNAIPEAYYHKGLALQNLRQLPAAREAWELVVKNYPDSTAALLARQRLQQIGPAQGR